MASQSCTFPRTGKEYVAQSMYRCRTCFVGNLCMCTACASVCHQGHDTVYDGYQKFFCDCGERGEPLCKFTAKRAQAVSAATETEKQVLECPVCMCPMRAPIYMCERGHSICEKCQNRIKNCPVCRGRFAGTRNLAMETLSSSLLQHCECCSLAVPIVDYDDHKKVCPMKEYPCPLQPRCHWVSIIWDMYDHCLDKHSDQVLYGGEHNFKHTSFEKTKQPEMDIVILGETVFLYHRQYNSNLKVFQAVVKNANSINDSNFTYSLTFDSPDSQESIVIKKKVRPVYEDADEIYNINNGAMLYLSQVTSILQLNSLDYTLKIQPL